jgi:hypothetical protein
MSSEDLAKQTHELALAEIEAKIAEARARTVLAQATAAEARLRINAARQTMAERRAGDAPKIQFPEG